MPSKILILGGTSEAREIATALVTAGHDVTSSLAGVTSRPATPTGNVRVGGFGGFEGLRDYLITENITVVVDATHPFAAQMCRNVQAAATGLAMQLLRFERPAWLANEDEVWKEVEDIQTAAESLPSGAHVFVTTGRKELEPFFDRLDVSGVVRTVEPPQGPLPNNWRLILERPPQLLASEEALFRTEKFTHLVSKNSGGDATRAKLDAARALGIPVVMVQRPLKPDCETYSDIHALIKRLGT